jgi:RNA polymerase sigma factor (sigma-70 family)
MTLNEILENKEFNKIFEDCVGKTFHSYKMFSYIEKDDFYQECCIYAMPRLLNYDSEKCSLKSYLYSILTCCAKQCFKNVNGHSKKISKLDIENKSLRLDEVSKSSEGGVETIGSFIKDGKISIEDRVINKMTLEELPNVDTLTPHQKFIVKSLIEEESMYNIACMLNCSESNVRNLIVKIRRKLVKKYT